MKIRLISILILSLGCKAAFAYPDLVRHGYPNCTSCHVAPDGGGVLTPYGRSLSREILSTWGYPGEEKAAYFLSPPEWLDLGGDYRSAYIYQNTPRLEEGEYDFMQLDVEAAAHYKSLTLDASIGYQDNGVQLHRFDYAISRQHYLMFKPTDEIAIRGGRFFPDYGIYSPNHSLLTRDTLDIFQPEPLGTGETYNLEFSYIGDDYNVIATEIFGRPDEPDAQKDVGPSLVVSHSIEDHYKVGLSYLYGTSDLHSRNVFGPWGILGFTPNLYLLTEINFQALTPKTARGENPAQWGFAETSRLGYEIVQGLNLIVDQEFARVDFARINTLRQRYGVGAWWFPRPHLELSLEYQRRQNLGQGFSDFYDYLYLFWHIYL